MCGSGRVLWRRRLACVGSKPQQRFGLDTQAWQTSADGRSHRWGHSWQVCGVGKGDSRRIWASHTPKEHSLGLFWCSSHCPFFRVWSKQTTTHNVYPSALFASCCNFGSSGHPFVQMATLESGTQLPCLGRRRVIVERLGWQ